MAIKVVIKVMVWFFAPFYWEEWGVQKRGEEMGRKISVFPHAGLTLDVYIAM